MDNQFEYLNSPLTILKGVGPKKAELFSKLGINTILDLIYYLPRTYEDRSKVKKISEAVQGELCCIKIIPTRQIVEKRLKSKSKLSLFLLYGTDGESNVTVKWFSAPFCKPRLKARTPYIVYGRVSSESPGCEFEMRYMEPCDEMKYTGTIVPVYHSTSGLSSKTISDTVSLAYCGNVVLPECLPDYILNKYGLAPLNKALYAAHHPEDIENFEICRKRLAFEELFVLQLALFNVKRMREKNNANIIYAKNAVREFVSFLPFELTDGQKLAINDICADLKSGKQMNRLIQGDVGCGKTAVASSVMYAVCKSGFQCAFMAPTEILASQHYDSLKKIYGSHLKVCLLTSSVKNKKQLATDIKNGDYDVVVGTHALLEENIEFHNLALAITDEQHRFGVNQRATLSSKGKNVHILVMSATPIPRTLSLILYGDVDVSVIKSKPFGRQTVDTFHIDSRKRQRAYNFVRNEIASGRQCYVVCPLVEESENFDAVSVTETARELSETLLKGLKVSVLHGKLKASQKDEIMQAFKEGKTDVLVSTTVVEVGVDVPNATVILIENAERFGLSQLHQLRGRVGRGEHKSYCILVSDSKTDYTIERMKIMTGTNDGFEISAKDLELRGGGEFFGTRQHGIPELKIANLFRDIEILKNAQECAFDLIKNNPELNGNEWKYIKSRIDNLFKNFGDKDIFN